MSTLLRTTSLARTRHAAPRLARLGLAGASFVRSKATLPDLKYDYGALEPAISGKIMELHHAKHHQTYVNGYNDASEKLAAAAATQDVPAQIALQPLLNFHGGGHVNHSLFWDNLAPRSRGGGDPPTGPLAEAIAQAYGGFDGFQAAFTTALAGIQGSGWAWLVKDAQTGRIEIRTYPNQDPVVGRYKPLLGVDAWEHAYYLDYQNRKAEYFKAIWTVLDWKVAAERFGREA